MNFSIVEEETIDDLDHDHGDGQLESDCSEEDVHDGDHDVDLDHDHEDGQVARMVDMQHYVRWSGGMQPSLSVTQVTIMLLLKKKKKVREMWFVEVVLCRQYFLLSSSLILYRQEQG